MSKTDKKYTHSPQKGKPGHCFAAQVWDKTGNALISVEPQKAAIRATRVAKISKDALNVYDKTGQTPSQLLEKGKDLFDALKLMKTAFKNVTKFGSSEADQIALDFTEIAISQWEEKANHEPI